jgi:hypothetical protein
LAAFVKAGELTLIVLGTSSHRFDAVGDAVGVVLGVGSGNLLTPWMRMHTEVADICCFCCSDACADGPPTGSSLRQAACGASNAGEAGLMPVPPSAIPPLGWGSGNAVTRWLRMHSEKARKDCACDEALGLWPDEPQAAIATAQITEGSAISTLRPFRLTMDLGCSGPRITRTLTPSRSRFDRTAVTLP